MAILLLDLAEYYALAGAVVAAAFLLWGIDRVDPNAHGSWVFRPLVAPGVILIWPLVLWRWWELERREPTNHRYRPPRRVQDVMAVALALAIPVIVLSAMVLRQDGPLERQAVPLAPPPSAGQPAP